MEGKKMEGRRRVRKRRGSKLEALMSDGGDVGGRSEREGERPVVPSTRAVLGAAGRCGLGTSRKCGEGHSIRQVFIREPRSLPEP